MVRAIAAAAAALALSGCLEERHRLEVANHGSSEVRVRVVYQAWVEDGGFSETVTDATRVAAGETVRLSYPETALDVRIDRTADGTVLYDEHLGTGDFEVENGRIEIAVYP